MWNTTILPFNGTGNNGSNNGNVTLTPPTEMSFMKYLTLTICLISVAIGLTGNLIIVVVRIFKQIQRGNTTAYTFLICQLAIADFIFAFTIIFDIHSFTHHGKWNFGIGGCRFIKTVQSASLTTTVGFLTIMAYERFCGISRPLQHRWSIKRTSIIVVSLWVYTFLTFVPLFISLDVQEGFCGEYLHSSKTFRKAYTMFLFITNFILPLSCVVVFHTLIVVRMKKHLKAMRSQRHRGSPCINRKKKDGERMRNASIISTYSISDDAVCGEGDTNCWLMLYKHIRNTLASDNNNNDHDDQKRPVLPRSGPSRRSNVFRRLISRSKTNEDRKLIQMLLAVTLSFAVMTLPTQIWFIWYDFRSKSGPADDVSLKIIEVLSSLVYLHCCSNCIIYSAMDKKFRADVIKTLQFIFNCQPKTQSRQSFQRVTMVSRLSRTSRHYSASSTTTSKGTSTTSQSDNVKKELPSIKDDDVFIFERETVIL